MKIRSLFDLVLAIVCVLWVSLPVSAQSTSATVSGRIFDPNAAVIVEATVTAKDVDKGVETVVRTNEEGIYVFANLPPGNYEFSVNKRGFKVVIKPGITLHVADTISLNFTMQVGSVAESVTVEGGAPLINTQDAAVSTVVDRRFVENMPLNGRTFQSLLTLTPGIILTKTNSTEQGQFSVNGQRPDANYFMVDGVSANIGVSAQAGLAQGDAGALPGLTASGGTNNLVSIDAMQEFRVQTSTFAPEFGRTPGAQISIVTRSGTNQLHGTAFDYLRNDVFDANDWFADRAGLRKPKERQNDFGGTFSGPLVKDHTFFFFSYEGLRLRLPQVAVTSVPSLSARQNAPPGVQPYLNAFPLPTGPENPATRFADFSQSFSNPSTLDATSIRLDHAVSSRFNIFVRYNRAPSETAQRGQGSLSATTVNSLLTQTVTGGLTLALNRGITNDFRANYSENSARAFTQLDTFGGAVVPSDAVLFPPSLSSRDSRIQFFVLGGTGSSFLVGKTANNQQQQVNLVDVLSIVSGAHQMKFGIDYRRLFPTFNPDTYFQADIFLSLSQVLTGQAFQVSTLSFPHPTFPLFNNVSLFGQDTWKLTPSLTLTYGLRWEYAPPPSEREGNDPFAVTKLVDPANLALAPRGTPLYQATHDNVAPRFGVAYQLSRKQGREAVIRGGVGIFYDLGYGQIANAFGNTFPNRVTKLVSSVPFPLTQAVAAPPTLSFSPPFDTIFAIDPSLKLPYTYQWNLAIEQSLGSSQTVSASYVAAVGRRLLRQEILTTTNSNFLNPPFATLNGATSDYHALQLQFRRRLSRGLQALVEYTFSHSIDDLSSDSTPGLPLDKIGGLDRGPSDFDVRHALAAAITYDIPVPAKRSSVKGILGNWAIDSVFRSQSATPVNVVTGRNLFGVFGVSRPDLNPGVPLYLEDSSVAGGRRFNPLAFTLPPLASNGTPTRQGTLGRNALRGFPMWQVDFAVRRGFHLTDRLNLQLRAEAFNLFNHPNFGDPDSTGGTNAINNSGFGQSINMLGRGYGSGVGGRGLTPLYQIGGPRSIQVAAKLMF